MTLKKVSGKENLYFERYAAYNHQLIDSEPNADLGLVVTIPCFNERELINSLSSLNACERPRCSVEVIIVINEGANSPVEVSEVNTQAYEDALNWATRNNTSKLRFFPLYIKDLPKKHAGVGMARKIAMDEALRRLSAVGNGEKGIIACFDADCTCAPNYLKAIIDSFETRPKATACSIHFEHPLEGSLSPEIYTAIIDYELFLRYYDHALKSAGFPYAHQTIGSSMAVRSGVYLKQGGMNRRKAGEDFYFLHKIIPLGHFFDLTTTTVVPSPRVSDRVPFGTGKAVGEWMKSHGLMTYSPITFQDLKCFLDGIYRLYTMDTISCTSWLQTLPLSIRSFLVEHSFVQQWDTLRRQSASEATFVRHFFHWFNGFKVLKYVHYARDHYHTNIPVVSAAHRLLSSKPGYDKVKEDAKELLLYYRAIDIKGSQC